MKLRTRLVGLVGLTVILVSQPTRAQPMPPVANIAHPVGIQKGKFIGVVVGTATFYTITLLTLRKQWYKKRVRFHQFNDNAEWLQMDKIGHAATAYGLSRGSYELMRWSGVSERGSIVTGGLLALLFQTTLEVFDGYSEGWGFSKGDIVANFTGVALFVGQQVGVGQQVFNLKYGFRKSIYPPYRPSVLGQSTGVQMLKDYNGQQYWFSLNLASIIPTGPQFPQWLNISFGYSGAGMVGGMKNPTVVDQNGRAIQFERYRQFFLSPDVDFSQLEGLTPSTRRLIGTAQFFKVAAPSLEYNRIKGVRFHLFLLPKE